jgi:hypothetical protein
LQWNYLHEIMNTKQTNEVTFSLAILLRICYYNEIFYRNENNDKKSRVLLKKMEGKKERSIKKKRKTEKGGTSRISSASDIS